MTSHLLRFSLGLTVIGLLTFSAAAQDANPPAGKKPAAEGKKAPPRDDSEDYRQYFHKPTNTAEFWDALQFEMEVGRYDLAAAHLRGLLAGTPSDEELVQLADKFGVGAFLKLRNVPRWSEDAKVEKEARQNVDGLIKRVTDAVRKVRTDPARIQEYIKNLSATPEENAYALGQLYLSGPAAIPYLIDAIRFATGDDRTILLKALARMRSDTIPAIVAALDSKDATLQVEILRVLRRRGAQEATPYLWYLSAGPDVSELVRREATQTLAAFLETPISKLPPAKLALTQEAERYYQHLVKFPDDRAVVIWRWDGKVVQGWPKAPTVPAGRAELYYGLHFARQALAIDPAYVPAQIVMLSLALEKAQQTAGLDRLLTRVDPSIHVLLSTVDPDLVITVLERAMRDQRPAVIVAALRDLGERAETRANKPSGYAQPPIVRALYYPDRRVQMAAAEALLRIPGSATSQATARAVDIFRRAVAAEPLARARPKVLVGYPSDDLAFQVANVVSACGYEPVRVTTGRDVMRRLHQAADIELVLIDEALPLPQLPWLLGELRADTYARHLPIILTAPPLRYEAVRRYVERWTNLSVVPSAALGRAATLRPVLADRLADSTTTLSAEEQKSYAERSIRHLAQMARGELPGYDVRPAGDTVREALRFPTRLTPEGQIAAIAVVGRLPGEGPQRELANAILEGKRPVAVRIAAAKELVRHIQENTVLLPSGAIASLQELSLDPKLDAPLKEVVVVVLGTLQPAPRVSGELLRQYRPADPGTAPAPAPEK